MANAIRDENRVRSLTGVSNADGLSVMTVFVDPITHIMVTSVAGGTTPINNNATHSDNRGPTVLAVSEVDGETPVPLSVNSADNGLIIEST